MLLSAASILCSIMLGTNSSRQDVRYGSHLDYAGWEKPLRNEHSRSSDSKPKSKMTTKQLDDTLATSMKQDSAMPTGWAKGEDK